MSKTKERMYAPHWNTLKQHTTIKVELSLSTDPKVLAKLKATLVKAIQKEKYLDINFRSLYPAARLTTEVVDNGMAVMVTLDKGLGNNDASVEKLFGDKV